MGLLGLVQEMLSLLFKFKKICFNSICQELKEVSQREKGTKKSLKWLQGIEVELAHVLE